MATPAEILQVATDAATAARAELALVVDGDFSALNAAFLLHNKQDAATERPGESESGTVHWTATMLLQGLRDEMAR